MPNQRADLNLSPEMERMWEIVRWETVNDVRIQERARGIYLGPEDIRETRVNEGPDGSLTLSFEIRGIEISMRVPPDGRGQNPLVKASPVEEPVPGGT